MENLIGYLDDAVLWITTIIGAASLLFQGLKLITGLTPSTRDDEIVSKVQAVIVKLQEILDRIALNPNAKEARDCPDGKDCNK